jgi:uncharacterized protein (TIGR03792 family)
VNWDRQCQSLSDIRQDHLQVLQAESIPQDDGGESASRFEQVIEHLRLLVPAGTQQVWLAAEQQTWEPWLRRQPGFLGRELLWDSQHQHGVLFIHWSNHLDWKSVSASEVAAVQKIFESTAKQLLCLLPDSDNPFPLVYEGEATLP